MAVFRNGRHNWFYCYKIFRHLDLKRLINWFLSFFFSAFTDIRGWLSVDSKSFAFWKSIRATHSRYCCCCSEHSCAGGVVTFKELGIAMGVRASFAYISCASADKSSISFAVLRRSMVIRLSFRVLLGLSVYAVWSVAAFWMTTDCEGFLLKTCSELGFRC